MELLQSPIEYARVWWHNTVWKDESNESDDEMEDHLKPSSGESENVVVLKVGIHCEECKRIVADALWGMPGVDQVDIDKFQQKVTVTGKVNPQRVLRKARRTGKVVEFWKSDSAAATASSSSEFYQRSSTSTGLTADEEEDVASCSIM